MKNINVNFLGLTSKHKGTETNGIIARNSKPQLFRPAPAETAGVVASAPSLGGSTPAGCGGSCNAVA